MPKEYRAVGNYKTYTLGKVNLMKISKKLIPLMIIMVLGLPPAYSGHYIRHPSVVNIPYGEMMVVGDGLFAIPWYSDPQSLSGLKSDYMLEALHNTVSAWIDYREWMLYPAEWDVNIARLIKSIHGVGLPAGLHYGFHVGDSVTAAYAEPIGFLHYYRTLVTQKWRFPNGSAAEDPYSVGTSRSFSGALAVRVFGEPHEIELYKRIDFIPSMQPQNPYWSTFFLDWGKKAIDRGADTFFIDSPAMMFVFLLGGGWGCADTWEGRGLIEYLKRVFTAEQLARLGVSNIEDFCLRNYLINKYRLIGVGGNYIKLRERFTASWPTEIAWFERPDDVLRDPIMRQALIYWYKSMQNFTRDHISGLHSYAKSGGRSIIVTVNQFFSWIPQITLTPYVDIIYIETNAYRTYPWQANSFICRMALSAGNYTKRVWIGEHVLQFSNPFAPDRPPGDISSLIKLQIAEHYSSGCLRLVPLGTGWFGEGWPPKRLVTGPERAEVARYYRFISNNRQLFQGLEPYSNVALLASLPTAIWNYVPALGIFRGRDFSEYHRELWGWARALEAMKAQYDVLTLGMEGVMNTDATSRLSSYELVIAPTMTHVSQAQLDRIREFLNGGGRMIITDSFARYDEMNEPRPLSELNDILRHPNVMILEDWMGLNYFDSLYFDHNPNGILLGRMAEAINSSLSGRWLVSSNADHNVLISVQYQPSISKLTPGEEAKRSPLSLYQHPTSKLIVFLVNYNYSYDSARDVVNPLTNVSVTVKIPQFYRAVGARLYSPDIDGTIPLGLEGMKDAVNFTVPLLKIWGIVEIQLEFQGKDLPLLTGSTLMSPVLNSSTKEVTLPQGSHWLLARSCREDGSRDKPRNRSLELIKSQPRGRISE